MRRETSTHRQAEMLFLFLVLDLRGMKLEEVSAWWQLAYTMTPIGKFISTAQLIH